MPRHTSVLSRALGAVALVIVLLATSCAGSVIVGENGVGRSVDTAVGASPPAPSQGSDQVTLDIADTPPPTAVAVAAEPEPAETEPAAAQPTAEPEPTPEPEPTAVEPAAAPEAAGPWAAVFADTTGPAPLIATGTGGGCADAATMWSDGFDVTIYLRDTSDVFDISSELVSASFVSIIVTLPGIEAWDEISSELSSTDALDSLSPSDIRTGFQLVVSSYGDPAEDKLTEFIQTMRSLPSVIAITDGRCTDNATPQLIEG